MPSGNKRMQINSRERVLSTDVNRLQSFISRDMAEVLRFALDAESEMDLQAGGAEQVGTATTGPMRATILNGLRCLPDNGTTNLFITPGVIGVVNPDVPANPDDGPYKWIVDAGVPSTAALTFTANATGSPRVDVIECARTDVVVESDNRDVFDPATGLFAAALQNKVAAGRMAYRVRLGSPNALASGFSPGWLPLAVVSSPNGAVLWDHAVLWDVRPLAQDLLFQPFNISRSMNEIHKAVAGWTWDTPSISTMRQQGVVETSIRGRRAGGVLRAGPLGVGTTPPTVTDYILINDASNQDPGISLAVNSPWYLWFCFPYGLPRWARYSEAPAGPRIPQGPRGIPVVTHRGPADASGRPASPIGIPTALGVGSSTSDATMALAGAVVAGPLLNPVMSDGVVQWSGGAALTPTSTVPNISADWVFTDNVRYPANARAIHVEIRVSLTTSGADGEYQPTLSMTNSLVGTMDLVARSVQLPPMFVPDGETFQYAVEARVPLMPTWPTEAGLASRLLRFTHGSPAGGSSAGYQLFVLGWELGP